MTNTDRRTNGSASLLDAVDMLNATQSHALGERIGSGCELAFIRHTDDGPLAICRLQQALITIDRKGLVDYSPEIQIRGE